MTSPTTKTKTTVAAKNVARTNVLNVVRPYAQQIALNQGVTSGNKVALGLNPRTSGPSPITPPASNPILSVQSGSSLALIMRFRDSAASPSVKSKPYGVLACRIFGMQSATPVTDPTLLPFLADATKLPFTQTFGGGDGGKQWYFAARLVDSDRRRVALVAHYFVHRAVGRVTPGVFCFFFPLVDKGLRIWLLILLARFIGLRGGGWAAGRGRKLPRQLL